MGFLEWLKSLSKSDQSQISLRILGWPTLEELRQLGLSGPEFHSRYVATTHIRWWRKETLQSFSERVLAKFRADYPQAHK